MSDTDKAFLITFALATILLTILFLVLGSSIYKRNKNVNFSLLRNFPYEIEFSKNFKTNLICKCICFVIPLSYVGTIPLCFQFVENTQLISSTFYLVNSVIFLLGYTCFFSLFLFNLKNNYKIHLTFMIISFAFTLLSLGGFINFSFNYNFYDYRSIIFCIIISIYVLSVFIIIYISSDRLVKLDKEVNEDGTISTKRPRVFKLALLEWFILFGDLIYIILNLIEFLSI